MCRQHPRVRAAEIPSSKSPVSTLSRERSVAHVSTRIRLAKPQHVVAVAEMNDGTLLMTKTWVDVATNGCA